LTPFAFWYWLECVFRAISPISGARGEIKLTHWWLFRNPEWLESDPNFRFSIAEGLQEIAKLMGAHNFQACRRGQDRKA
jgi:hypothetical protein